MRYLLTLLLYLPLLASAQVSRSDNISQLQYADSLAQRLYTLQVRVDSILNVGTERLTSDSVMRTFNTAYQVSATRPANVRYSIKIACKIAILGKAEGSVVVETSPDGVSWRAGLPVSNEWDAALAIGTHTSGYPVGAFVKAGWWVRLRTVSNTTGLGNTVTFTFVKGQETTL